MTPPDDTASDTLALPDRETWLKERLTGIGASDAAAVLGVSPFKTPFQLYAEKLGLAEPSVEETEAMKWGRLLEPAIAEEYASETKRALVDPGRYTLRRSRAHPVMLATLDREIAGAPVGVLEIKTASAYRGEEWAEEPPLQYQVQVQHQLAVTGYTWGSLAVLLGGQRFLWVDVPRNDRFIALLIERCEAFWAQVQRAEPPLASGEDREALARVYPKDDGASVPLPEIALEWDRAYQLAGAEIKKWEAVRDEARARLQGAIGPATYGVLPGGLGRYAWKSQARPAYTVEAQEFRTLRRLKA